MENNYVGVWSTGGTRPVSVLESSASLERIAANIRPLLRRRTLASPLAGCLEKTDCWIEPTTLFDAELLHMFLYTVTGLALIKQMDDGDFNFDNLWTEIESLKDKPCMTETVLWLQHPSWKTLKTGTLSNEDMTAAYRTLLELLDAAPIEKMIERGLLKEIIPSDCRSFISNERSQVTEFENVKDRLTT
jgi:hypothetical protein